LLPQDKIKVGAIILNSTPSAYIRVVYPYCHASLAERVSLKIFDAKTIKYTSMIQSIKDEEIDVLLIQRTAVHPEITDELISYCKDAGIKIIYEIDDDLVNIDATHPNHKNYVAFMGSMKKIAANADAITVSTENLRGIMSQFGGVTVVQNRLEESLWVNGSVPAIRENTSSKVTMGYIGSYTHEGDIKLLHDVVKEARLRLAKEGINLEFEVIGGLAKGEKWFTHKIVPKKCELYPLFVEYLTKETSYWDFVVAPLADTSINKSKSALKYLEYSALRLPGIYSNIGEYSDVVINNETGVLVSGNDREQWVLAVYEMASSAALRQRLAKNAYEHVMEDYLLEKSLLSLSELLHKFKFMEDY